MRVAISMARNRKRLSRLVMNFPPPGRCYRDQANTSPSPWDPVSGEAFGLQAALVKHFREKHMETLSRSLALMARDPIVSPGKARGNSDAQKIESWRRDSSVRVCDRVYEGRESVTMCRPEQRRSVNEPCLQRCSRRTGFSGETPEIARGDACAPQQVGVLERLTLWRR